MFLQLLLKSLLLGAMSGFAIGAGAARMYSAPKTQGMGSFRTLGEMNACEGDPISHFSFGLGFFFSSWASSISAGAIGQDINHRIIPNWTAAILLAKNKNVEETLHNPKKMALVGSLVGAVVLTLLNTITVVLPDGMRATATLVLMPAADWLVNPIMPVIFWLAALDAGQKTGFWGTVLGGLSHLIMGNAVPGVVLGILLGKGVEDSGWNRITRTMFITIIVLFILCGFLRGIDLVLFNQMGWAIPEGLQELHNKTGSFQI